MNHVLYRALKGVLLSGAIFLVTLPTHVFASEIASDINVTRAYNLPHFLLGGSLGAADHSYTGNSETSYSLFAGLTVVPFLAVEFGWIDFGTVGATPLEAKSSATFVSMVGSKKLSTQFGFYGKLGLNLWKYEVGNLGDDTGADMMWGLGMQWRITQGLFARMGMDFYSMGVDITKTEGSVTQNFKKTDDVDVFQLGIMYGF